MPKCADERLAFAGHRHCETCSECLPVPSAEGLAGYRVTLGAPVFCLACLAQGAVQPAAVIFSRT
jgi:hypothetical protein